MVGGILSFFRWPIFAADGAQIPLYLPPELDLIKEDDMSSKNTTINIKKVRGNGEEFPAFVPLIHRHFEKSRPVTTGEKATLNAPLDLLGMILPDFLLDEIESIEIIYER